MKKLLAILSLLLISLFAYPQTNTIKYENGEAIIQKLKAIGYNDIPSNVSKWLIKYFTAQDISKYPNVKGYIVKCALGYISDQAILIAPMEIKYPSGKGFQALKSPKFFTREALLQKPNIRNNPKSKIVLNEKVVGLLYLPDERYLLVWYN